MHEMRVGAEIKQLPHERKVARRPQGVLQRSMSIAVPRIDIRARLKQRLDEFQVPFLDRLVQRPGTELALLIGEHACGQQADGAFS